MKRSLIAKIVFATSAGLLLVLAASAWLLPRIYVTRQTVNRSFTIDADFTQVRKILVRTDSARQIITMTGDSELLDQHWTAVGGTLDLVRLLDPQWRLELHGVLSVRTLDDYVGANEVTLRQAVNIERDYLHSEVDLREGSERLLDYEMTTRFERDDATGTTRVVQRLLQEIRTDAPWFAHWIADRRVRRSAERALVNQERAIRRVIDDNRDKRWLLPLR